MPRINILTVTTLGVDAKTNPLFLGNKKLHWATNLSFDEGVIRTRPGIEYSKVITQGQFQGAGEFRPAQGMSSQTFGSDTASVVIAAGGDVFLNCNKITDLPVFKDAGNVEIFQAENYLILQNEQTDTFWYDGVLVYRSPGMQEQNWNDPDLPRTDAEVVRPVSLIAGCETLPCDIGEGGGGGGEEECTDGPGTTTFSFINSVTGEEISGVTVSITMNGNIVEESETQGDTYDIELFEGLYEFTFSAPGFEPFSGAFSVLPCTAQDIVIPLVPLPCFATITDITLGEVGVGGITEGWVTLENTGDVAITITGVSSEIDIILSDPPMPFTIEPGMSVVVHITFTGDISGTTTTFTTDCDAVPDIIVVWGSCDHVIIATGGGFGDEGAFMEVTNTGSSELIINSIDAESSILAWLPDSSALDGESFTAEFPVALPAGSVLITTWGFIETPTEPLVLGYTFDFTCNGGNVVETGEFIPS